MSSNTETRNQNETAGISKALEDSKKMLEMLNKAAIAFVSQSEESFEKRIEDGVRAICDMAELDRFCIFRNLAMPDSLHILQEYRWDREAGGTIEIDPVLKDVTYAKMAPRWETILASNEIVNGPVETMPESAMLRSFGVVSALVVPLFIKNAFWGFALFEDRHNERYFDKEQTEMMCSAAFLCANVFIQWQAEIEIDKTSKALESSKQMLEMLNKAAITFVSQSEESFEKRIEEGVRSICDMAKLDRFSVFRNFNMPDGLHSSQIYRWDREAGGTTEIFHAALKDVTYAKLVPKWESILAKGEVINGPSKLMPESTVLKSFGVVSAFVVPLFFKNAFWGFALFEDRHNERYFDEVQVEMMRSAAFLCINTLIQWQMETDMRKQSNLLASKLKLQKSIAGISENFILYEDINISINLALEKLGKNLDVSRMVVFHVDYENKNVYAVNQWYANNKVPMVEKGRFTAEKLMFPLDLDENSQRLIISCSNTAGDPQFGILESMGIVSFIYAPLYVEGSLWGVVCAENCVSAHEWTEDERTFFATVSNIISGSIMRNVYSTRLQQSLDKVVALSKSKDDFLSKISHEIRTPMNAILGIAEIQLQNETAPQKKEALSIIHNSGKSLLHIVNDLLDLSKIEAKKMEIVPVKYEVASLINDTVQLYAVRIEKKLIKFSLKVNENIPAELFGDELRIKQILNNILSNAFKYTDIGEISMSVAAEKIKDQDCDIMLIFRISDTGQGMTEEQKSRIFDEYYRFNLVNNRTVGGTGLGMTIVQNLVTIMGGKISIESEINKGSTFTISLPQKIASANILGKEIAENLQDFQTGNFMQIRKQNITRNSMAYGSVLVVDDLESNLYVAKSFLEPYDLSIETAISGFEAIDKIKSGKIYDIIFMDHMMPKMDGIEAVKIIRSLDYEHPIVALTANAIVGQAEIFLENGFDAFISKPIDAKQLDAELNRYIRDKQMEIKKQAISKANLKGIFKESLCK
ncbi:aerobic respiration control sensor protein ArcB [Fibrobacteria bacterium R8-3-H12]